jgi:hypothetical protein
LVVRRHRNYRVRLALHRLVVVKGRIALNVRDVWVVRRVAAVAYLTLNQREHGLTGVVFAVTFAYCLCLYGLPGRIQLAGTRPAADAIRIVASKEALAVAVPKLFAFSVEFEDRHHLPTFPISRSVNLQ